MGTEIAKPNEQIPTLKTPQELVHVKHKITLLQYKYWVLMVRTFRDAYENGEPIDNDKEYCYLSMSKLEEFLGYAPKTNEIEKDLEAVRVQPIVFNVLEKDKTKAKTGKGFISEWYVSSNRIGVIFPAVVREAIKNLDDKSSMFHLLNWQVFNSFTGKYEAILYKLCKDFAGSKQTKWITVESFREYMGVKESEYPDFKRLNQWVISTPIKRINESELSEILVKAEFDRERRKVVRIKFHVAYKKQTMMDFGDNPAFRFAKVHIEPAAQKEYLAIRAPEEIEQCIERANVYAEGKEKLGESVSYGAIYRTSITEGWHVQHIEQKKKKTEAATKKAKAIEADAQAVKEKNAKLQSERDEMDAFLTQFGELPEGQKKTIRAAFRETLTVGILTQHFDKDGERSRMHMAKFRKFALERM